MNLLTAVRDVLRRYADFTGSSGRPEFWWFALFSAVTHLALNSLNIVTPQGTVYLGASLSGAFGIVVLVPTLAVTVRRLRSSGRSPLFLLWLLLPVAGLIVVIVQLAQPALSHVEKLLSSPPFQQRQRRRDDVFEKSSPGPEGHLIIVGSIVAVALVALGVVLTVGGIFVPANYLQPWAKTYANQFHDPRMKVVAQAELAPSGHNMQPWKVVLDTSDSRVLYLYTDASRLTLAVDPLARQTLVSQGTFLEYLHVSAAQLGYSATFLLFPGGQYDEAHLAASMSELPVAKITLTKDPTTHTADYASIFLSDTNRAPYTDRQLTGSQIATLTGLADTSEASLKIFTDTKDVKTFDRFGVKGTLIETQYAAATKESDKLFYSTEGAKNTARSGFAVEGQGTTGFMKYLLQGLITIVPSINDDAAGAKNAIALTGAAVAHTPAYGLISTPTNTRTEQVEAGMLYASFSLRARTLGLVMQPLSQVLQEYPSMAGQYAAIHRDYAPAGQTIQMLVRIGSPTTQYPNTMRRDAGSLVATK